MQDSSLHAVTQTALDLSICIVNWNTKEYLKDCLESLQHYYHSIHYEIIVVDNASADGSPQMVSTLFPDVTLIQNPVNEGYAYGNNQALHRHNGRYVLFLNPDTVVPAGVLEKLVDRMDEDKQLGIITCQLRNFDGSIQNFCSGLPTVYDEIFLQTGFDRLYPSHILCGHRNMNRFSCEVEQQIEQPPGTFILTRSAIIEQLGGFDEEFPLFYNDVDLCKRVKDAGWKILFTPEVFIYHHKSASIKQNLSFCLQEAFHMRRRYYRKYFSRPVNTMLKQTAPFIVSKRKEMVSQPKCVLSNGDRILIIKSAFDSHFNSLMASVSILFSEQKYDLLSLSELNENTILGKESCVHNYIVFPKAERFTWSKCAVSLRRELRRNRYKAVIFPHGTVDGAGYWNVFFMASALRPKFIMAYGLDQFWELRKPYGVTWWRGRIVCCMAYLLLIGGYAVMAFHFLNRKIRKTR